MRTVISQSVVLPAPAESLFAMYTDPAKHAVITGAPVAISVEPGSPFQAFNGALTGATLQIIPQRLVIQSWRSTIPKPLSINLKRVYAWRVPVCVAQKIEISAVPITISAHPRTRAMLAECSAKPSQPK
jgi:hypothetical protein